jgi:hypothetical protein
MEKRTLKQRLLKLWPIVLAIAIIIAGELYLKPPAAHSPVAQEQSE